MSGHDPALSWENFRGVGVGGGGGGGGFMGLQSGDLIKVKYKVHVSYTKTIDNYDTNFWTATATGWYARTISIVLHNSLKPQNQSD